MNIPIRPVKHRIYQSNHRKYYDMSDEIQVEEPSWQNVCDEDKNICFSPYTKWTIMAGKDLFHMPEFSVISVLAIHMEVFALELGSAFERSAVEKQAPRRPFVPYPSLVKDERTQKIHGPLSSFAFLFSTVIVGSLGFIGFLAFNFINHIKL